MSTAAPALGSPPSGRAKRTGLFSAIRACLSSVSEGIEYATRYRMLAKLSDEELAALGVTRKDIARIAVNGWKID